MKLKRKKILGVISLLFVPTKSSREESPEYRQTRQKYKSTEEGMMPIIIYNLQFGRKRIKMSASFNGRNSETVGMIRSRQESRVLVKKRDEVKRFCQDIDDNNVVFQNCSFVISKDLKFS